MCQNVYSLNRIRSKVFILTVTLPVPKGWFENLNLLETVFLFVIYITRRLLPVYYRWEAFSWKSGGFHLQPWVFHRSWKHSSSSHELHGVHSHVRYSLLGHYFKRKPKICRVLAKLWFFISFFFFCLYTWSESLYGAFYYPCNKEEFSLTFK